MKKLDEVRWGRSLATTFAMILLVVVASFVVIGYINRMEEEQSFQRLFEEAGRLADTIELYADSDREELRMLAAVIAKYESLDAPELWELLDSYTNVGMMSRVELLLPDDTVLVRGGKRVDASGRLSFQKEAALGEHITDREMDLSQDGGYVVRHYVPVVQDGRTVALLYGVITLGELPEEVNLVPYGGEGAMYIIDGKTGDFLVDTWHPGEVGNMWDMGQREMAPGYDAQQLRQGVSEGDSRYVVFVSQTVGEYLYFYYEPMAINHWRIAVSVPESVVFESANAIGKILNQFLLFELCCFVAYFLWMVRYARQVTNEKQRRLEMLNHIYDVEKLLFNAHERRENLKAALERIGEILPAEKVGFWLVGTPWEGASYLWEREPSPAKREQAREEEGLRRLRGYFEAGHTEFEGYGAQALQALFPQGAPPGIQNIAAVPVEGLEGGLCGLLVACNLAEGHESMTLLKNLKFSFGMFCRNLKIYTEIKERGERDVLTGLYNRNRYERDLPQIYKAHREALACVYIDVNGLHELNNTQGHDKGDRMLWEVAEEIRAHFDTEYAYRTGGDEFVLFLPGAKEEELEAHREDLTRVLAEQDYHISVGIDCQSPVRSLEALVKGAEERMYAEKRRYYQQAANDRRRDART